MALGQPISESNAKMWVGHLVCVALKDGSYYLGKVTGVKGGELFLTGVRGDGKMPLNPRKAEAKVSGMLGSLFGGGGPPAPIANGTGATGFGTPGNALGGGAGFFGKIGPGLRFGLGMLRFIMPLLGKFFF